MNTEHFTPVFGAAISSVTSQMLSVQSVYTAQSDAGLYRALCPGVPGDGAAPGGSWETRARPPANEGGQRRAGERGGG